VPALQAKGLPLVGKIDRTNMTTFFLSTLLLLTIVAAFAFGVAAGYWVICGFLNFFNPARGHNKTSRSPALAPSSGD
jgi:hypothetical protein